MTLTQYHKARKKYNELQRYISARNALRNCANGHIEFVNNQTNEIIINTDNFISLRDNPDLYNLLEQYLTNKIEKTRKEFEGV